MHVFDIYKRFKVNIVKGKGIFLFDDCANRYLDFSAAIATVNLGHCHEYIIDKLVKQSQELWHCYNTFHIPLQEHLAVRLTQATFADKVFFCSSGLEAIEAAIKLMRLYHYVKNTHKYQIITFTNGFHGRSIAGISAGGNICTRQGFAPLLDGFITLPSHDIPLLEQNITPQTAGILLELVQVEGGVYVMNSNYVKQLRALCDKYGILLCFDEVQTGYGRSGALFHHQTIGVTPDIMTCAKAMGNGFPIGACLATNEVASAMTVGTHGSTYGGNPLAMAVGNAVLDIMLQTDFFHKVREIGKYLTNNVKKLQQEYPDIITAVRQSSCLIGLQLNVSAQKIVDECMKKKLIITKCKNNRNDVIRLTPPLIIEKQHVEQAMNILNQVLYQQRIRS